MIEIERCGRNLIAQRQHGENCLKSACSPQQMPRRRLCRTDGDVATGPEHGFDRGQFAIVADRRGCGVSVEVLHFDRGDAGLTQGDLDRASRAVAIFRSGGHVIGV